MTDTPSERVEQARRAIYAVMDPQVFGPPIAGLGGGKSHADVVECQRLLDALVAAVRAEERARVREMVEGMLIAVVKFGALRGPLDFREWGKAGMFEVIDRHAVLALLTDREAE
jgi:hypothetical protein